MGRGEDGVTITHEIELEFNRRGDSVESTFDVEIEGLGQKGWVIGPGSATVVHSYKLSNEAVWTTLPNKPFDAKLKARARSHTFTQNVDARITFR